MKMDVRCEAICILDITIYYRSAYGAGGLAASSSFLYIMEQAD